MGTNKANPSAMVLSATMMLRHLGLETQANTIASAVYDVIQEGKVRTADMRGGEFFWLDARGIELITIGTASTSDFTKAILAKAT